MREINLGVCLLFLFSVPATAATLWLNPGQKNGLYAYNPQYENYKEIIETPLRGLKVPDNFTLVDDFDSFMLWHKQNTSRKWPDNRGVISFQTERGVKIDNCVDDAKTLIGTSSIADGIEEGVATGDDYSKDYTETQARCTPVFLQRFLHRPKKGAQTYANILRYWDKNNVLTNINQTTKRLPTRNAERVNFTYATRSRVGDFMAHFALYHRLYDLSSDEIKSIDKMFTSFAMDYDYYSAFKSSGPNFARTCNLGKGATVVPDGTNDHCGSANLRIAVGATLYGLEFGNQIIFDYGIRHLEITLGTFDENRAYSSQINRGMYALSYASQIVPEIDKLDYAFQKAFGLDFLNMKTPHGATPGEVYKELLLFANEPQRMLYYFYNNGYGGDRRAGDFEETIARIVARKAKPSAVWGAFTLEDYYLRGGKMALSYYPVEMSKYLRFGSNGMYMTNAGVGFNNLILRQATGQIPTDAEELKIYSELSGATDIKLRLQAIREAKAAREVVTYQSSQDKISKMKAQFPEAEKLRRKIMEERERNRLAFFERDRERNPLKFAKTHFDSAELLQRYMSDSAMPPVPEVASRFQGQKKCKINVHRVLSNERVKIAYADFIVIGGQGQFGEASLEIGNKEDWQQLQSFVNIVVQQDGVLLGFFPMFTMFGSEEVELFQFTSNSKDKGRPSSPEGQFLLRSASNDDLSLDIEISKCLDA